MDNKFTELLKLWLDANEDSRDYDVGAMYLLKLSGNQIQYRNIIAAPENLKRQIISAQIKKYYDFRLAQMTHDQVKEMQSRVDAIAAEHGLERSDSDNQDPDDDEPKLLGKRDDHDSLPDDIKARFIENLDILRQMRELHMQLRHLSLDNVTCPDSERYPFLKELISLDEKLHENWQIYDSYVVNKPVKSVRKAKTKKA